MKRILITGSHGYIGSSFQRYLQQFPEEYKADTVSLRNHQWEECDFSVYDAIVHAAGLAHIKETAGNAAQYYKINRDLTVAVAEKAKREGVRQFVFFSSMSVYGVDEGVITPETPPSPKSHYGKSKLEAEQALQRMQSDTFAVAILRPPMVYGEGCKGNYQTLVKLSEILPVCPDYHNQRSMISINNLCAYLQKTIELQEAGIFWPKDPHDKCTCQMIRELAHAHGRHLRTTGLLNFAPVILKHCTRQGRKAFGDLVYKIDGRG